jgi:hypothetical protein
LSSNKLLPSKQASAIKTAVWGWELLAAGMLVTGGDTALTSKDTYRLRKTRDCAARCKSFSVIPEQIITGVESTLGLTVLAWAC